MQGAGEPPSEEVAMQMRANMIVVGVLAIGVAVAGTGHAAEIKAVSCSQAHVQLAINLAADGDVVLVPAGSATWATTVSVPSSKKITLKGAGMGATIIKGSPPGRFLAYRDKSGSRLTGIQFIDCNVQLGGEGWRVDHCFLNRPSVWGEGVLVVGETPGVHPTGLVDHCVFRNARVNVYGSAEMLEESDSQHLIWAQPFPSGSGDHVVYVEDNEFTFTVFGNVIDANFAGRFVFRHNVVTDSYLEVHSVQENNRACQGWEIYENTFRQVKREMWAAMFIRGGTGVVFNNTITGKWETGVALNNVRDTTDCETCGLCDGTSTWDENTPTGAGYACRDQIGRGRDTVPWTPGDSYNQPLDPAYFWNNTMNGSPASVQVHLPSTPPHIVLDRDYRVGVEKPSYTPYVYPHPLIQAWVQGQTPDPPTALRLGS
jgi:hypothetical protein